MSIRCEECNKGISLEDNALWDSWRSLAFYLQLQLAEGDITEETYDLLMEHLLMFKRFAINDN